MTYEDSISHAYQPAIAGLYQEKPNRASWRLWKRLLLLFTLPDFSLRTPLGIWSKNHSSRGIWQSYISSNNLYVMYKQSNRWIKYKKLGNCLSLIGHHRDFNLDHHFRPIHINCLSNGLYYYSNRSSTVFTPPLPPKAVDWYTMMLNQPQWIQNLLSCIDVVFSRELATEIQIDLAC